MKNKVVKYTLALLPMLFASAFLAAQEAAATEVRSSALFNDILATSLVVMSGVVLLGALLSLVSLLNTMVKMQQIRIFQEQGIEAYIQEVKKPAESLWTRLYKGMTRYVPVEKEKDILFDHEYDGIRELDNSLPPWWVWLFYVTIGFAGIYMTYYHFAGIGKSSREQYEVEVKKAEEAVQAYLAKQANNVDENSVTLLTSADEISLGRSVFDANCAACHGMAGEGGVGPNLTDEYWIHGGTIKDVFKTIKYGVPEKGMIAWKAQLRPQDMQRLSSYILSLQGSNPPNAKEPQGDKVPVQTQTETPPADSTQAIGLNQ